MRIIQKLSSLFRNLFARTAKDRGVDEELESYVELLAEEKIRAGLDARAAWREARVELGGKESVKEKVREYRFGHSVDTVAQDIRYGLRMLRRNPGFTAVAVLTLALGIGANTAIFSVVNTVLLRPLPYPEPDRLVAIRETEPSFGTISVAWPNYVDWIRQDTSFEAMAAYQEQGHNLAGEGEPVRVRSYNVTANLFSVLAVRPSLGRTFLPEEDRPGGERAVVLSHSLWQRLFGRNPDVLGRSLLLDEQSYTIIAVMPAGFSFPIPDVELWTSLGFYADENRNRADHPGIRAIGRLGDGVSLERAHAALNTIARRLGERYPQTNAGHGVHLEPYHRSVVSQVRPLLLVLLGAVAFVLLVACANVANLLLARSAGRRKEMAIRAALGAGRRRLIGQMLTESALLALLGGVAGVLLAWLGIGLLEFLLPAETPRLEQITIDPGVLAFAFGLSLLTGAFFGLAPAVSTSKTDLQEALKEGGRSSAGGSCNRLRHGLIVAEVALALVLLVGAGLMLRSFALLQSSSPGFNPENLLTLQITLPEAKYPESAERAAFVRQLVERVKALPGVESAATVFPMPLNGRYWQSVFVTEENPTPPNAEIPWAEIARVSPAYFRTMQIALLRGRAFTEQDDADSLPVAVVDESFARTHWPNRDPIGRRIKLGYPQSHYPWRTVVGVVRHVELRGVNEATGEELYVPEAQSPLPWMNLVVRSSVEPLSLVSTIRREVLAVDPQQPIFDVYTMDHLSAGTMRRQRVAMLLLGVFALLAVGLASVGIYGVIAYSVSRRTHEIGIRMALGAQPRDVRRMVLKQGGVLILAGLVTGLAAAFALTRFLESLLFEVSAADPATFGAVGLLLAVVGLLACYVPARRATKVDPMVALRYE